MKSILLSTWVQHTMLLLHICASLFWMGWIVFIFLMLVPTVQQTIPDELQKIMPPLQQRVRKAVFWMILIIVLTGLYNMYVLNLYHVQHLFYTDRGQRFLIKLTAASLLFGIYFLAPYLMNSPASAPDPESDACCSHEEEKRDVMGILLHVLAFTCGMIAAYLGLTL